MTHNLGMAPYRLPGPGICPPDFKSPSETTTTAPSNPKKRRKTSNQAASNINSQPTPTPQDLLPPPLTGYGDTIVASNPFDDTPTSSPMSHNSPGMGHMGMHPGMNHMHHHHMGGPPMRGMNPMNMNSMGPMGMSPGPGMGPMMGPHMVNRGGMSPMGGMHGAQMGGLSPMGNMGPSMSPMGPMGGMSPMGGPNSHMGMNPNMGPNSNRSMGSPMSGGPIGSPMNSIPMGSPMGGMGSPMNPGGPNHMNNGQMGPPMHSPLGNGPPHMQGGPRMNVPNGAMTSTCGPMPHPMSSMGPNNQMNNPMNMNTVGNSGPMSNLGNMNQMGGPLMGGPGGPGNGGGGRGDIGGNNNSPMNHQNVPMSQSGHMPPQNSNPMNSNMHNMGMGMSPNHQMNSMGPMGNHGGNPGGPGGGGGIGIGPPNNQMGMFGPKPMPVGAGKIYPPNQPMVFNPQNPNAPPIYPCGVCHKEVHDNDQAMLCESGCNFWFHRACSGLTEEAFQFIHAEIYAEWVCDKCLSSKNIPLVKFKP